MKIYLKNFFSYLQVSYQLVKQLRTQQKYIQTTVEPILLQAKQLNDGTLEENDFTKIRKYYALFVVAIIGECYCTLRGNEMNERERKTLTFQGALTGLYDDFFDKEDRKNKPVQEMMNAPFTYKPKDSIEKLFIYFLQQVHQNLENKIEFNNLFQKIYEVQIETEQQINSTASFEQLKQISETKGGLSHLFYRITLSNSLIENEYKVIYNLGSLLQQVNDIFDVWKDTTSGIATFVSISKDVKKVKTDFEFQMHSVYIQIKELSYSSKQKQNFFLQLMILIGMGIVCLDQYIALQEQNKNVFDATNFTRKQLVCDMQKKTNLLKLMKVCLIYDFKF